MEQSDKQEILEAICTLEERLTGRIDGVESSLSQRIDGVETILSQRIDVVESSLSQRIDGVETILSQRIDGVEQHLTEQISLMAEEVHGIDMRLKRVESQMVTKDYLDNKLSVWHGRIIEHVKARVPNWMEIGRAGAEN